MNLLSDQSIERNRFVMLLIRDNRPDRQLGTEAVNHPKNHISCAFQCTAVLLLIGKSYLADKMT
uniref:Uncharacterized protein n=1 Tax=Heterorhabditis bacteriophora TaxID=37862 RepID=A0A1I7WMP6_HETBA